MPLPVSSAPLPPDVASTGWAAITVRVAWVLLTLGVRTKTAVLRDARDHALFHIDPATPLARAEDLADYHTQRFVKRARRQALVESWPNDVLMPPSPRWRRAIEASFTPLTEAVFRQHYGDGRTLAQLEKVLAVDRSVIEGARGGLREVVRQAAHADGLKVDDWANPRLDALLRRLSGLALGPCPPVLDVVEGAHADHVTNCPRCHRAVRLVRGGILTTEDLLPPLLGARPEHQVTVLALHLHPEARQHRTRIAKEAGVAWFPVGEDLVMLDASQPEAVHQALMLAAEVGCPARHLMRGSVLSGRGRWSPHGLLGPIVERGADVVLTKSWGAVDALGELPEILPPPPSSKGLWIGVAGLAAVALVAARFALVPASASTTTAFSAEFTEGRGGVWAELDTDESAVLTLVRQANHQLEVVLASDDASDKAEFASGDGSYRLHAVGDGLLVVSSPTALADLPTMLASADEAPDPLRALQQAILAGHPGADTRVWQR